MNAETQPRWLSVRKWERLFLRSVGLPLILSVPLVVVTSLRQGDRFGAIAFCVFGLVWLRYARSLSLCISVLPDGITVSPMLSVRPRHVPLDAIGSAVYLRVWHREVITIYQRNRLNPPVVLYTGFMSGYSGDDWELLLRSLRTMLEPAGKWEEAPWWKPWFPF